MIKACIFIVVFVLGVIAFSYLNVLIEELPKGIVDEGEEPPKDLLPLKERLWKGIKGYLSEKKTARRVMIGLFGGVVAIAVVAYYGMGWAALTLFLFYYFLTAIAFIDKDTQYIPPELNIVIALLGVLSYWTLPGPTVVERLIGAACISVPLLMIVFFVPEGFGGGDIKLMAAAGVFLGWKATVVSFFIGVILGGAFGVYLMIVKRKGKKYHFAFGPFLSVGIAIAAYAGVGTMLMQSYIDMLKMIGESPM